LRLVSSRRRPGDETDAFPARFGRRSGIAKAGRDVRFVEYPDAQHAYDAPAFKTPLKVAVGQKWGDCRVGEENGVLINKDTGQPFAFSDVCVKKGTTVAYNEEAAKKSFEEVKTFLKDVFSK